MTRVLSSIFAHSSALALPRVLALLNRDNCYGEDYIYGDEFCCSEGYAPPEPTAESPRRKPSLFAVVGEEAKREAQRKLLLKTCIEESWKLTVVGEKLGMGEGPTAGVGVIRALKLLAPEEYAAARKSGAIAPGKHREE
jgi:hypothetical protein